MTSRFISCLILLLITVSELSGQTTSQPFSSLDRAVESQRGGWAGDKSQLSAIFASERRQLGDRFEAELLKWLGNDVDRHYVISLFLEAESYLHGNKRLPQLSLLVMEQGLSLVRNQDDEESQGYVVSLGVNAATLSAELGLLSLAISHKDEAEALLKRNSNLSAHVPAMYEADRRRYENIPSKVAPPTVIADTNPPPQAPIAAGVLNGRALKLVKPSFPPEARSSRASGTVEVRIVFDEQGKVIWARATSGHPLLQKVCEDAAWQSTFPPTKLSGQFVKVSGILVYNFVP